jgi:hypothetical protein
MDTYAQVRSFEPDLYSAICAFASVVGTPHDELSLQTRYDIERFCMWLMWMQIKRKVCDGTVE